jgi:transglutaminase-like putative cysteine protease
MTTATDAAAHLAPGVFVDSDAASVVAFAREAAGEGDDVSRAVRLYYAVRDRIVYTPYLDYRSPDTYRASAVLARGAGFCVGKAALLAAAARAIGIPARVGFADVQNHLCTPRLRAWMGSDVFYYHGYAELSLRERWVKATPAFDRALCERFGVIALEFDGLSDSLFQPFDRDGRRHLEYLRDRGPCADVPVDDIVRTFAAAYPKLSESGTADAGAFRDEAGAR